MSSDSYYPEVDLGNVRVFELITEQMSNDPLWTERDACPYDADTRAALREVWVKFKAARPAPEPRPQISEGENKWTQVSAELATLFNELRDFSLGIDEGDVKDRMAYFRTATSLLDKMVGLQERAENVKAVSDFQKRVMNVFEEVLSPEQRTQAMEVLAQ